MDQPLDFTFSWYVVPGLIGGMLVAISLFALLKEHDERANSFGARLFWVGLSIVFVGVSISLLVPTVIHWDTIMPSRAWPNIILGGVLLPAGVFAFVGRKFLAERFKPPALTVEEPEEE